MRFLTISGAVFLALVGLLTGGAAQGNVSYYVRANRQITLRDGTRVPIGSDISVRGQEGEDWIPSDTAYAPSIPKSEADPVQLTVFDLPVDGTVTKLTSVYERLHSFRSFLISRIAPSSQGLVLSAGQNLKIIRQEGDFYIVNLRRLSNAMVPVAYVDVAAAALAEGRIASVPTAPKHANSSVIHSPPRAGWLYGRLKVPYTLDGKTLSAGDYITLAYDADDEWIVLDKFYRPAATISKTGVDVVAKTDFLKPLTGRITKPTTVYKKVPDISRNPNSLEQSEVFSNLNPSVHPGDEIYIRAREGDDYIAEVPQSGRMARPGRVPVASVEIIAGDPESGVDTVIGPMPQNNNPTAVRAASSSQTPPDASSSTGTIIIVVAVIAVIGSVLFLMISKILDRIFPSRVKDREAAAKKRKELDDLWAVIKRRFPDYDIFYVPDSVRTVLKLDENNRVPAYSEDYFEHWTQMIERYPFPPQDEEEREIRSVEFWQRYADKFTTTNAVGKTSLKPKQEILDYFTAWEKWVFRDYYAATGEKNKTISEVSTRVILAYHDANNMETFGDNLSLSNTQKRQAVEKTGDAYDRHNREEVPTHFNKWGGWFLFHIQEAFRHQHQKDSDYGPQSATSSASHPAHDDLSYKPNA